MFKPVTEAELQVGLKYAREKFSEELRPYWLERFTNESGTLRLTRKAAGERLNLPDALRLTMRSTGVPEKNGVQQRRFNAYVSAAMKIFSFRKEEIRRKKMAAQATPPQKPAWLTDQHGQYLLLP